MSSETAQVKTGLMGSIPTRVKLLISTQILGTFTFGFFLIYLTAYLVETHVFDAYHVGLVIFVQSAVLILAGVPLGVLSDRRGRKWILIFGNALIPLTFVIFALTTNFSWYLFAAALGGLAEAASLGTWNAIIADQTELANRDAAFSLSFIVSNVFISAGFALPLVFPFFQSTLGLSPDQVHSGTLLVLSVLNIGVPFFIWSLLRNYHETPEKAGEKEEPGQLRLLLKFSGINGIIGFGAGFIIPILGTWFLYKFAITDTYSGPFLAVSSMTIAFAAVGSPRLSMRLGLFRSILATAGSSTFFMLSLAFVPNVLLAGGIYLIRASLMNMAAPLMDSFLMGIVRPGRRGLSSALAAIVWRLPNSVTTVIGGFILDTGFYGGNHFYYDLPWILAFILYVIGIGLLYFNFRNVKPSHPPISPLA